MGRFPVHAGRVVRCHDRRLGDEERSAISPARDILALGSGLDSNGRCALRGAGIRHQLHRRALLLSHHHGGSGNDRSTNDRFDSFRCQAPHTDNLFHFYQVYISEISMPGIRGCLSAMLKVLGHVGVLLSYIAGTYLNWRQSALLVAVAPSMLFLGTLFIPETPSYLVLNGKDEEAASSLQWLRGEHVDIRHELQVISEPEKSNADFCKHDSRSLIYILSRAVKLRLKNYFSICGN